MSNEYFQPGSVPAPNSPGSSAIMRNEFASIATGFDKLPVLAGHADEVVVVNSTGTSLVSAGIAIADLVTLNGVQTLTNKTISWADNTFPGFGNAATRDAGLLAGNVLLLQNNNQLPPIDGSLLTGINAGMVSGVTQINRGGTGAGDLLGAQHNLGINLKAPIQSPVFTGAPMAPTPPTGDTSARLATTFFVTNTISAIGAVTVGSDLPLMDGVASPGNLALFAASRQDHVHPSDTSRAPASAATAVGTSFTPAGSIAATNVQLALQELDSEKAPLASPAFTGVPTAPTVSDSSDTTTKIATTAWVQQRLVQIPIGVQLSDMNAQNLGTNPGPGVGVEASRWDHVHAFPIASQIPNLPAGTISATSVQGALNELDTETQAGLATKVSKSGDTMTGNLAAPSLHAGASSSAGYGQPGVAVNGVGTIEMRGDYPFIDFKRGDADFDYRIAHNGAYLSLRAASGGGLDINSDGTVSVSSIVRSGVATGGQSGDTLARKDYVDGGLSGKVAKSGDTMSGNLTVPTLIMSQNQDTGAGAAVRFDFYTNGINQRPVGDTIRFVGYASGDATQCYMSEGVGAANGRQLISSPMSQGSTTVKAIKGVVGGSPYLEAQLGDNSYWAVTMTASDERTKQNIQPTRHEALPILNRVGFIDYDREGTRSFCGVSAQNLQSIDPRLVVQMSSDMLAPASEALLYLAMKAIQELSAKVDALEAKCAQS